MRAAAVLTVLLRYRVFDYVICIILGIVGWAVGTSTQPHCRSFSWTDSSIDRAYGGAGTFPSWTLTLISILPGVFYVIVEFAITGLALKGLIPMPEPRDALPAMKTNSPLTDAHTTAMFITTDSLSHQEHGNDIASSPTGTTEMRPRFAAGGGPQSPIATAAASASVCVYTPGGSISVADDVAFAPEGGQERGAAVEKRNGGGHLRQYGMDQPQYYVHRELRDPWIYALIRAHFWVLAQAFSITLNLFLIDTTKLYAGRLRPDFLARLRRAGYTPADSPTDPSIDWCKVARGGRLSFPSGHSGISFASFVVFSLYCMHLLQVFGNTSYIRITVGLLPLILPITVAISRTRDNRHHFDDILAGSIIGTTCALLAVFANLRVDRRCGGLAPRLQRQR